MCCSARPWTGYAVHLGFMLVGAVDVLLRPKPAIAGEASSPDPATE